MNKNTWAIVLVFTLASSLPTPARQSAAQGQGEQDAGVAWSELEQGMEKMHAGMHSIEPSGDNDIDFVRLMLPHHQAAIDMAKAVLAHGKDPQMRRLAQEIITDQQSEIDLMRLWLKQHELNSEK
jgi:uncharacterized protein (DUF305 family)